MRSHHPQPGLHSFGPDDTDDSPRRAGSADADGGQHGRGGHRGERGAGRRAEGPDEGTRRGPGGRGKGGPRGGWGGHRGLDRRSGSDLPDASEAAGWFAGRLPEDWFTGSPDVIVDRDEILVIGEIPALTEDFVDAAARSAAEVGRISRFREQTRADRIDIARQAEHRYGRQVSWGARIGDSEELFTTLSAPVMTRLRQPERQVLDTLVAAGVARSRSDALVWAVRLVGEHADEWLGELRSAMEQVDRLRAEGPDLDH
jgi:hypothetical protein